MLIDIIRETESGNRKVGKIAGRFLFLYFVLLLLPLNSQFWRTLADIPKNGWNFSTLFYASRYTPGIGAEIIHYYDLLWLALIAALAAGAWMVLRPVWVGFQMAYYWLRSAIRVRLFLGAVVYALIKIFPLLAPYPTLSDMNTTMGELTSWKLFTISIGIVPGYQSFIGYLELAATFLLLHRKTASLGAFVLICSLGNAWITNIVYDGGEGGYSFYLLSLAVFVFGHDACRLYKLTVERSVTPAEQFSPVFNRTWVRSALRAGKLALVLFAVFFGVSAYTIGASTGNKYPAGKGLPDAAGLYKVTRFVWNGVERPPSLYDSLRWKDVVFEPWATISIRTSLQVLPGEQDTQEFPAQDTDRIYESSESSGRHYFSYTINYPQPELLLRSKNNSAIDNDYVLKYQQPDSFSMVLSGRNGQNDSLYVELQKIEKIYLLNESFRNAKLKKY